MAEPIFGDSPGMLRKVLLARVEALFGRPVPVSTERPNPLPAEFIRILLVGGQRKNPVTVSRTFAVEGWALSSVSAIQLIEGCYAIIHSLENTLIDGVQVGLVEDFSLPADLPDPDTEHSRFTFTTSIDLSYINTI